VQTLSNTYRQSSGSKKYARPERNWARETREQQEGAERRRGEDKQQDEK